MDQQQNRISRESFTVAYLAYFAQNLEDYLSSLGDVSERTFYDWVKGLDEYNEELDRVRDEAGVSACNTPG